jgi:DNA-directed RNA polymerase alpha subunit
MDPTELPHRVSQTPKEATNPKTPKRGKREEEWRDEMKIAQKISAEATAIYEEENAKEPSTPMQRIRVFSRKIEELEAQIRLADCEAEYMSSQVDEILNRDTPEDKDTIASLLQKIR